MVLGGCLYVSCVLLLLCLQSKVDTGKGADESAPSSAPEHDARRNDGEQQAVVVASVAPGVNGRRLDRGRGLLLNHYDIRRIGGDLLRLLRRISTGLGLVIRRRDPCVWLRRVPAA